MSESPQAKIEDEQGRAEHSLKLQNEPKSSKFAFRHWLLPDAADGPSGVPGSSGIPGGFENAAQMGCQDIASAFGRGESQLGNPDQHLALPCPPAHPPSITLPSLLYLGILD
ncbi:hypothetical protein FIBSPDRAFT_900345 [Athelia psychrophila]|uniref:Uncharacterized protein n=1 Tax=Athelia psychrophila TaxID=1759441 RepID=A0A165YKZ0_9AGAM|nr:hypothetical protein FIBSPDRAFT_900345 [Fibularhizoctonia sp. CBS 109695]